MATEDIILQALMADAEARKASNPWVTGGKIALGAPRANFNNPWAAGLATLGQTLAGGLMQGYGQQSTAMENDKILNAYLDAVSQPDAESRMAQLESNPDISKYGNLFKYSNRMQEIEDARALDLAKKKGEMDLGFQTSPKLLDFKSQLAEREAAAAAKYRPVKQPPSPLSPELQAIGIKLLKKQPLTPEEEIILASQNDQSIKQLKNITSLAGTDNKDEITDPILGNIYIKLNDAILNPTDNPIILTEEEKVALKTASPEQQRILSSLTQQIRVGKGQDNRNAQRQAEADYEKSKSQVNGFELLPTGTPLDKKAAEEINKQQEGMAGLFAVLDTIEPNSPWSVWGEKAALNQTASTAASADLRKYLNTGAALTPYEVEMMNSLNSKGLLEAPFETILRSVTGRDRTTVISAIKKVIMAQNEGRLAGRMLVPKNPERRYSDAVSKTLKELHGIDWKPGEGSPEAKAKAKEMLKSRIQIQ